MHLHMHVLFLAKGTRGDVQPAAVLAHALRSRHPQIVLHFVTHLNHEVILECCMRCHLSFWLEVSQPILMCYI